MSARLGGLQACTGLHQCLTTTKTTITTAALVAAVALAGCPDGTSTVVQDQEPPRVSAPVAGEALASDDPRYEDVTAFWGAGCRPRRFISGW